MSTDKVNAYGKDKGAAWYNRVLRCCIEASGRQIMIATLVLSIIVILIQIFLSEPFVWIPHHPFSPFDWDQISLLTYLTIGSILYHLGFYLVLYRVMIRGLGLRYRDFEIAKDMIWLLLMYFTYQAQLIVFHWLNVLTSVWYNSTRFIIFLWPSFAVVFSVLLLLVLIRNIMKPKCLIGGILP